MQDKSKQTFLEHHAPRILPKAVPAAHALARMCIRAGDTAIDATAGNGYDTLFLAQTVGEQGMVYAFDITEQAIATTAQRLQDHAVQERVRLIHAGHETMSEHITEEHQSSIRCVMFNLGFLPHGGRATATRAQTTVSALSAAYNLLAHGGMMLIACYRGHDGGEDEYQSVLAWAETRNQAECQIIRYEFLNQINTPPVLIALEKEHRQRTDRSQ
jgi:predicted methyltransferase